MERLSKWRLIRPASHSPFYNMALDEAIFLSSNHYLPTLRFYTWNPPVVSIGYFQKINAVKNIIPKGIAIVRRPTGGEAVFHSGDLSYSIVFAPQDKGMLLRLNKALVQAIRELPIRYTQAGLFAVPSRPREGCRELLNGTASLQSKGLSSLHGELRELAECKKGIFCFAAPSKYDITINERKIGGASFKKRRGIILQQGFISLSKNLFASNSLGEILRRKITPHEVATAIIKRGLSPFSEFKEMPITKEELALTKHLIKTKYKNLKWVERR